MPTQLPAKILQIHTVANSPGIQETFVYRVLFDAGRQLLQQGDHAVTQASVELVIAGKNVQFFRKLRLFELEPGGSHLYTQPFGFSTPGNNAAIVVTENDDRFAAQIRSENLLATGVEGVDVCQGEHQSALRVL